MAHSSHAAGLDMSSGLPDERDFMSPECPDVPKWSENFLFTLYDPDADLAMWLHLGTVPDKWTMWEDRVLVMLPGRDGIRVLRDLRSNGFAKPVLILTARDTVEDRVFGLGERRP